MVRMKRNDGRGFLARLFGSVATAAQPESRQALTPAQPRWQATSERRARPAFACSTCGRTDLPEAGGWEPPVCEECDAAINFDWELQELDELE
jgi:hypothetical protein